MDNQAFKNLPSKRVVESRAKCQEKWREGNKELRRRQDYVRRERKKLEAYFLDNNIRTDDWFQSGRVWEEMLEDGGKCPMTNLPYVYEASSPYSPVVVQFHMFRGCDYTQVTTMVMSRLVAILHSEVPDLELKEGWDWMNEQKIARWEYWMKTHRKNAY